MKTFSPLMLVVTAFLLQACTAKENNETENRKQPPAAQETHNTDTTSSIQEKVATPLELQTYVVGTTRTYAPFEFKDDSTNQRVGFDIDLLHAIGEKENISFQFIEVAWENMRDRIRYGSVDALANGIAITEDRKTVANFSDPYLETYGIAFTLTDSDIKTINDLSGKTVCAIKGDYTLEALDHVLKASQYTINEEKTMFLCINKLRAHQADAVIGNVHVSRYYRKNTEGVGSIREIPIPDSKNQLGFAVAQKNAELVQKINSGLKKIQEDGTYDRIHETYFGKEH